MAESSRRSPKLNELFDSVGGLEACRRLSDRFHVRVEQDPELRRIFPKSMTALSERLALFIGERVGGPATYTAQRGKNSLVCRHASLFISTRESDRWLSHMFAAIDDIGITEPARDLLRHYFAETAQTLTDPYIPFYHLPLDELRETITQNPPLLQPAVNGQSLLSNAVCRWDAPRVRLLLELGTDANTKDSMGHRPLYRAANTELAGAEAEGRAVTELLIRYGADVNWQSGPGNCAALHMAARRGSVFLAEILLDSGADIEVRDSKGETPLRRAVNCAKESMVRFLLSRGADPLSLDKQGRTPADAARSESIRKAFAKSIGSGPHVQTASASS